MIPRSARAAASERGEVNGSACQPRHWAAATFFWREKVYNEAERFAALASYIDPVHPDLLELRREIREHRIRYRASELTNAWPR